MRSRTFARDVWYAGVAAPLRVLHLPTISILPALYSKYAELNLVVIGSILIGMRILDAAIDPLIGFYSDGTRSRLGRRKPWILTGSLLACAGALIAFNPSATTGYVHFAIGYFLLVVGWSMAEIPHMAWMNEITTDYQARSRLATYRYVAGMLGGGLFLMVPLLGIFATTEMTPEVTSIGAWIAVGLFLLALPPMLLWLDNGDEHRQDPAVSVKAVLRSLSGNRPFLLFVAMQSCSMLASGIVAGLFFFYLGTYLQIGGKYSHIMLSVYVLSVLGALFWLKVTTRVDRHRIIAACALVVALCNVAMYFISPGPNAMEAMIALFSVTAFAVSGSTAAITALLADIVDYGTLRTGENHAGNYFAASTFLTKCFEAVGGGLGLVIAGLFGFSAKGPNDATAMAGFFLAIVWIPCVLNLVASALAWQFPIDRKRQFAIRSRLDRRARRAGGTVEGGHAL